MEDGLILIFVKTKLIFGSAGPPGCHGQCARGQSQSDEINVSGSGCKQQTRHKLTQQSKLKSISVLVIDLEMIQKLSKTSSEIF